MGIGANVNRRASLEVNSSEVSYDPVEQMPHLRQPFHIIRYADRKNVPMSFAVRRSDDGMAHVIIRQNVSDCFRFAAERGRNSWHFVLRNSGRS